MYFHGIGQWKEKGICLIYKNVMDLILWPSLVTLWNWSGEKENTSQQQGATELVEKWVVIHKQGLQETVMYDDLVELNCLCE